MTKLEYLLYIWSQKGLLFIEESRLDEVIREDRDQLLRQGYIRVDEEDGYEMVSITRKGLDYLNSVE